MFKAALFLVKSRKAISNKVKNYKKNQNFSRIFKWIKLLSKTGATQIFIKGIGFISGIIIINFLSIEEYAFYTLANTVLATMILLADGGISAGVMSQGGNVWRNKDELGKVVTTGLNLRKKFAAGSVLISIPIMSFLLWKHSASLLMIILIISSIIPAFYARLSSSILGIVSKLHQDIDSLQKNDLKVEIGRLALTASFIFIYPFSFIAILANGLSRLYGNKNLKKLAKNYVNFKNEDDPEVKSKILKTVKRVMPGTVYYCLSGQITIWLISFFGSTTDLGQLGALGRLVILISLFNSILGFHVIPRFARMVNKRVHLLKYYVKVIFVSAFLMILFVLLVDVFSTQILWILGEKYSSLEYELLLAVAGSSLSLIAGFAFSLNLSRDWVLNPVMSISISIFSIIIGIFWFDVSSLLGVLKYNIFLAVIQLLLNCSYSYYKFKILQWKQ